MHRCTRRFALLATVLAFALPSGAQAFTNGHALPSEVSPAATGISCPGLQGQLANDAAAGFNAMALEAGRQLAISGCDSAYRPYDRQVYWRDYWCSRGACGNAALPGTSNHGLGRAIDVPQWMRAYIDQHGYRFGWAKSCSDAQQEWWHILSCTGAFHHPDPGADLANPVLRYGSGGPGEARWVKKAQRLLRAHGARKLTVDGFYGHHTRRVVIRFQRAERLHADGVLGHKTWHRLRRPVENPQPEPPPKHVPHAPEGPVRGVDVSVHRGSIDWAKVRHADVLFAIQKATEGQDYRDPSFTAARMNAIGKAHLVPGVYHYLRPRGDRPGSREATWFTQNIAATGYGAGYLPPVVDVEETALSPAATCTYLRSFVVRVQHNLRVRPIIYTYPGFAQANLAGCGFLPHYRLWIAHYGVSTPIIPAPWRRYWMWQYSSTGSVAGISGNVDVNVLPRGRRALLRARVKAKAKLTKPLRAEVNTPTHPAKVPQLRREAPPAAHAEPLAEVPAPEGEVGR